MPRYFSVAKTAAGRPRSDDSWYALQTGPLNHPSVYPSEPAPTGLCDVEGRPIYRSPDELGFLRFSQGE
jgi:hypothetical protein